MTSDTSWAVFVDRDGVINAPVLNPDSGRYESPYDPAAVVLLGDALGAIRRLRALGASIAVVSNQPAAAKGTCTLLDLAAVHGRIVAELARGGAVVDYYGYCFHHPDAVDPSLRQRCGCRKPAPGMLLEAASIVGVNDLARCYMVGDSDVDVEAGRAAGCRTVLIDQPLTAHRRRGGGVGVTARSFAEAVQIIAVSQASTR